MDQLAPAAEGVLQAEPAERRIASLRARISAAPERVGMRIRLAHVLEECGRTDEALATLRQAVAYAPEHRRAASELKALAERWPLDAPDTAVREISAAPAEAAEAALLIPSPSPEPAGPTEPPDLAQLLALPQLGDFGWRDPGAEDVPPSTDAAELAIGPRTQRWRPSAELLAGLAIVATVGTIGALSRLRPHTLLLAPPAQVTFLPRAPAAPDAGPEMVVVLPAIELTRPAPRVAVDALRTDLPPLFASGEAAPSKAAPVESSPAESSPPLPDTAPLDVTVAYRGGDPDGALRASQAAARLMQDGGALRVTGRSIAYPGRAGVFYFFDEDGQGARAVASLLGNDAGPVLRPPRGGAAHRPGEILVVLAHGDTITTENRKDFR